MKRRHHYHKNANNTHVFHREERMVATNFERFFVQLTSVAHVGLDIKEIIGENLDQLLRKKFDNHR